MAAMIMIWLFGWAVSASVLFDYQFTKVMEVELHVAGSTEDVVVFSTFH